MESVVVTNISAKFYHILYRRLRRPLKIGTMIYLSVEPCLLIKNVDFSEGQRLKVGLLSHVFTVSVLY